MAAARRPDHVPTILGALLVLAGVHVHALELGGVRSVSYGDIGGTPAILMQVAAVGALVAVLAQRGVLLKLSALGLWVALLWPLLRFGTERLLRSEPDDPIGKIGQTVADAVVDGVGHVTQEVVPEITSLEWGALVLLVGCVLVTRGALKRGS
ncbi:MAG: hypothetical protein ACYTG2_16755 [Planctomycetota bacterium]|jgi:hypothetical protein